MQIAVLGSPIMTPKSAAIPLVLHLQRAKNGCSIVVRSLLRGSPGWGFGFGGAPIVAAGRPFVISPPWTPIGSLAAGNRQFCRLIGEGSSKWRSRSPPLDASISPSPPHDGRTHRNQKKKGPFSAAELKTKTTVIARKLKRTAGATYQKAMALGVTLGEGRKKRA
jgi:hypothetical protein